MPTYRYFSLFIIFILISCSDAAKETNGDRGAHFNIGGQLINYQGSGLTLFVNGKSEPFDIKVVDENTKSFEFTITFAPGQEYIISLGENPSLPNQDCSDIVQNNTIIRDTNDLSILITCTTLKYKISGVIYGTEEPLTISNNGSEVAVDRTGNSFVFPESLDDGTSYDLTVSAPTTGEKCIIENGTTSLQGSDVLVTVRCAGYVEEYYSNTNWNDYVEPDSTRATPTACTNTGNGYYSCAHAGEIFSLNIDGLTDCVGVTANDELNAFNWRCIDTGAGVHVKSISLANDKYLSTLIDFTLNDFKLNSLSVFRNGEPIVQSLQSKWLTNPMQVLAPNPDNLSRQNLQGPGMIFVVNTYIATGYDIISDKVALVIKEGVALNANAAAFEGVVIAVGRRNLWIEGYIHAAAPPDGSQKGIYFDGVSYSVLRGVHVAEAFWGEQTGPSSYRYYGDGISLINSNNNLITWSQSEKNLNAGILLQNSNFNHLTYIKMFHNNGLDMVGSSNNVIHSVNAYMRSGITFTSRPSNNIFSRMIMIGNEVAILGKSFTRLSDDVLVASEPKNNLYMMMTLANNRVGIEMDESVIGSRPQRNYQKYIQMAIINNIEAGIIARDTHETNFYDIASAYNDVGVTLNNTVFTDMNYSFHGDLKLGNNRTADCRIDSAQEESLMTDTGVIDGQCVYRFPNQPSFNGITADIALSGSLFGKVIQNDAINQSDIMGAEVGKNIIDWFNFENQYRTWAFDSPFLDNVQFLDEIATATIQPNCRYQDSTDDNCRIMDWRLLDSDVDLKDIFVLDQASKIVPSITHEWSVLASNAIAECGAIPWATWNAPATRCETTFLRFATEIIGDGIGNENSLCESNEECILSPNIGAFQGEGPLVKIPGNYAGDKGIVQNVILYKHQTSGVTSPSP